MCHQSAATHINRQIRDSELPLVVSVGVLSMCVFRDDGLMDY